MFLQYLSEFQTGELTALVGVEDLRLALPQRLLQGVDAEVRLQSMPPTPIGGVIHLLGHQVEKSPGHGRVGDVGRPRLIGSGNLSIPKQIGVDLISGAGPLVRG